MRLLQRAGRLISVVGLITFLPTLSFAEPKPPTPSNPPRRGRPGLPNSFARDYKLDRHLTDRSENSRDPRETVDAIVTLNAGQELTPQFRRYVCGPRLDIINGYALCHLPVNLLKQLASNYSIHRAHYNRSAHEADILSSSAIQADLLAQQFAYTGAGVSVAFIDSGLTAQSLPDLADNRVLQFVDFLRLEPAARRRNGHGTHVAGVAAYRCSIEVCGHRAGRQGRSASMMKPAADDRQHHRGDGLSSRTPPVITSASSTCQRVLAYTSPTGPIRHARGGSVDSGIPLSLPHETRQECGR
jgi:hypothetical protein